VDWDDDGKKDLIAGDTQGNVSLFLNVGTKEKPELAKAKLVEADGKPIKSGSHKLAGTYSKLHMADWDGDGLNDLLIGHQDTIVFYRNVGTKGAPRFAAPTQVKPPTQKEAPAMAFPGRPSPYVIDWDGDGKKDLLVGFESPEIRFYRNVGTDKNPQLANWQGEKLDLKVPAAEAGYRWRFDVTDWNNDGKPDLLVGNIYSGRKSGGNLWLFLGK
jgi:hypothetical protein